MSESEYTCAVCQVNDDDINHSDSDPSNDEKVDVYSDDSDDDDATKAEEDKQSDKVKQAIYDDMYGSHSDDEGDCEKSHCDNEGHVRKPRSTGNGRSRHRRTSNVVMPTEKRFSIVTPRPTITNCNVTTTKIMLHPRGKSRHEYNIVKKEMLKTIAHNDFKTYKIFKIEKLINGCLWKKYRREQNNIYEENKFTGQRMLFHGSVNIDEIVDKGFNEQHSKINGMFGAGLYFADKSSKANLYCFGSGWQTSCIPHNDSNCFLCIRKMLLCRISLGRTKKETVKKTYAQAPVGYNSVMGVPSNRGLKYAEYIVYRAEQVYPEFLITYKISN